MFNVSLSQWTLKKKSLNFIFPTKYVIPKSLKFSHWPSKMYKLKTPKTHKLRVFVLKKRQGLKLEDPKKICPFWCIFVTFQLIVKAQNLSLNNPNLSLNNPLGLLFARGVGVGLLKF